MPPSLKSDRRIIAGFIVAILGLIVLGFFLQKSIRDVQAMTSLRASARKTAFKIASLESLMTDAETGQRGYLLTRDQSYLTPYSTAVEKVPRIEAELTDSLHGSPEQLLRLDRARELMNQKLNELATTIQLSDSGQAEQALTIVKSGAGFQYQEQLHEIFKTMIAEQTKLIDRYQTQTDELSNWCARVVAAGSLFAIMIVGLMLWILSKNQKQRTEAALALHELNSAQERRRELLSRVVRIQNEIATSRKDPHVIMQMIVSLSSELTQADGAIIEAVEGDELVYRYVHGHASPLLNFRMPRAGSFSDLCIEKGEGLVCNDSESDGRVNVEACRKVGLRSMIVVPLQHAGRTIGVLKNYCAEPNSFDDVVVGALDLVIGIAASALSEAEEFQEKTVAIQNLEAAKAELTVSRDEARSATEAKSRFLANMSHEVRTPLNGILGMSDLLLDTHLQGEAKEFATAIKTSGETLLALVNDILDFSKIEAGRLRFEELDFDLHSTLQDIHKSFSVIAGQKDLSLTLEYDSSVPHLVNGDPGRVRQILMNLIGNAIKFTARGGVHLKLTCLDPKAVRLHFEIKDSGIGIPEDALENLFEEFTQADVSTTRKFGGTGLGLAISKRLVEQMNGELTVESKVDQGSTFSFTLKLSPAKARESGVENASMTELPTGGRPWRVLVGEDNQVNQVIIKKMLEKLDIRCEIAGNGKEVIAALQLRSYDLVFMDCHMPEMDGYDATAFIRESKSIPDNRIPIIAMTANAMQGDREKTLAAGMDDYLSKPVDMKKLREMLAKWLVSQLDRTA